jgi:hypothetical protein
MVAQQPVCADLELDFVAEVSPVADLYRVGQGAADGLGVGGRAVAAHDLDTRMFAQPGLQGGPLAVGQDRDASAGLGVRDDRGVAVAAQGEIVHADHLRDRLPRQRQASQMAQCGTAGNGHGQQPDEACGRPAAQLPRHLGHLGRLGHLPGKPHRAALMALQQSGNLLAEGLPSAAQDRTDQPPYAQVDDDLAAVDRHVRHRPGVIPVHLRRQRPALGTRHRRIPSASRDHHRVTTVPHVHDDQHRQPGKKTVLTRGLISITRS